MIARTQNLSPTLNTVTLGHYFLALSSFLLRWRSSESSINMCPHRLKMSDFVLENLMFLRCNMQC